MNYWAEIRSGYSWSFLSPLLVRFSCLFILLLQKHFKALPLAMSWVRSLALGDTNIFQPPSIGNVMRLYWHPPLLLTQKTRCGKFHCYHLHRRFRSIFIYPFKQSATYVRNY